MKFLFPLLGRLGHLRRLSNPARFLGRLCWVGVLGWTASTSVAADWFDDFRNTASPAELHAFVYAMPKGGDLHNHITGSVFSEWYLQEAIAAADYGYRYYTKVRIANCRYGSNEFGGAAYLLLFRTIPEVQWQALSDCEQGEYVALTVLTATQREAWLNSLRLDQPFEGRNEFFEAHWPRLGGMVGNPQLVANILARNLIAFGAEGLLYLETQVPLFGFRSATGEPISPDAVMDVYRRRLAQPDVRAAGVTVRMQVSLLRFLPNAEDLLKVIYATAARHPEIVAVNMVGREDNGKGYPLRFLSTLRELRRQYSGVRLSIHAGEVDEPNQHVRDTLVLGAERIGHGFNLITDPDTMLLMRQGRWLVEINLISNLLLEYVDDYSQHPFPEYLRTGIPVALSTDDRGMWDSNMTDEFFVAVTEFNLSWKEIRQLSRNSLAYSFLDPATRDQLLRTLDQRLGAFERKFRRGGLKAVAGQSVPPRHGFICRRYQLCAPGPG